MFALTATPGHCHGGHGDQSKAAAHGPCLCYLVLCGGQRPHVATVPAWLPCLLCLQIQKRLDTWMEAQIKQENEKK